FQQLSKDELRQDAIHDFICQSVNGQQIAMLGSKTELITLELTSKLSINKNFPYVISTRLTSQLRPLDKLAEQVDLQGIYERSNVLELQQLSLESVYSGVCSLEVPAAKEITASWAPRNLPNGKALLASLNSYGSLELLCKGEELVNWQPYKQGLDINACLMETLLPPFSKSAAKIGSFKSYQEFMHRCWITMCVWRPTNNTDGSLELLLGTAAGSLWLLKLDAEAKQLLGHATLNTDLDRISLMRIKEELLLVADQEGRLNLYKFSLEEGFCLIKQLWQKADRLGLQAACITYDPLEQCHYIVCCKAAHLLCWCLKDNNSWLETRLHVGGIKITALCELEYNNFAVATARGQLYSINLSQHSGQLGTSMQRISYEDSENFNIIGLVNSLHRNFLTVLLTRTKEYLVNTAHLRVQVIASVGKLYDSSPLQQLTKLMNPLEPINMYPDLLADIRMHIFNEQQLEFYVNYAPLDSFNFEDLATVEQLHQLQLKYHVLQALRQLQAQQSLHALMLRNTQHELELLLVMLSLTHIRLRLQYLNSLSTLTAFQTRAASAQLTAAGNIKNKLAEHSLPEPAFNVIVAMLLAHMELHFETLEEQLLKQRITETTTELPEDAELCSISYLPLTFSLSRHYCTLCGRQAWLQVEELQQLYPPGRMLLCPCCHGRYTLEICDA
ncbi:CG12182, partial [Drosophila busckii]